MHKIIHRVSGWLWVVCLVTTTGCQQKNQPTTPSARLRPRPAPRIQKPTFSHQWFRTPKEAFQKVLQSKPEILGVGEIHQVKSQEHIPSAIQHFHQQLLSSLWGKASDLIVETWVTTGQCGTSEVKVARQVRKMTQRPKQTENHIVTLLKAAKHHGIQPHILTVHCKTYQELLRQKGTAQAHQLILLITRLLLQKLRSVYAKRRKGKQKGIIVLYGGALHNDTTPDPSLAHYSYVPKLQQQLQHHRPRFVELDLYVPEYLLDDQEWRERPWYPLYQQQRKTKKTLLIQRNPRSFILLLPWSTQHIPHPQLRKPKPKPKQRR